MKWNLEAEKEKYNGNIWRVNVREMWYDINKRKCQIWNWHDKNENMTNVEENSENI